MCGLTVGVDIEGVERLLGDSETALKIFAALANRVGAGRWIYVNLEEIREHVRAEKVVFNHAFHMLKRYKVIFESTTCLGITAIQMSGKYVEVYE